MKTTRLRGASALALVIGTSTAAAFAQTPTTPQTTITSQPAQPAATASGAVQTPQQDVASEDNRVVITGSLIATTPEDAPKPVEVYTIEDLKNQGSPSTSEFIRSLTAQYGDDLGFGQAVPEVPSGAGFANANLRGIGSNATLVMLNGRRVALGGFGADLNTIPMEALEAVEVLKDGASATYGAGAVGGVLNFRTRRDINAPQISIERTFYEGSEGEYKVDFLTGWAGDASNLLLSISRTHVAPMGMMERDFSSLPFALNPAAFSLSASNPGRYHRASNFYSTAATGPTAPTILSGSEAEFNRANCNIIGGELAINLQPGATAPNDGCAFQEAVFQDLVNESTQHRIHTEFNGDISDTMSMHMQVSYSQGDSYTRNQPIDATGTTRGATAGANTAALCASSCNYVVPVQVQTYTAAGAGTNTYVQNPFIASYNNWIASNFPTRASVGTTPGNALFMSSQWRPFLYGGNPYTGSPQNENRYQRMQLIVQGGVDGEFSSQGPLSFLNGIKYDYSAQYNQYHNTFEEPDIIISRLQNALLGYGGPGCNAIDRVTTDYSSGPAFNRTVGIQSETAAGTNGCQWFNPFASSWTTSVVNNAINPAYTAANAFGAPTLAGNATARPSGYLNPSLLLDWLYNPHVNETKYESSAFEALWTGELPKALSLPGGPIGWAVGARWQNYERRDFIFDPNDNEQEEELLYQNCPWPDPAVVNSPAQPDQDVGQLGCLTAVGAFFANGRSSIALNQPPEYTDQQSIAYYTELQLPVLDNLNFTASWRRESYNGRDVVGDIWSIAGKYNVTDNFYVRASYGTNFRASDVLDLSPGTVVFDNETQARFGTGFVIPRVTQVADNLAPEDDTTLNLGIGYEVDIGEGRLRAGVDFFEIAINGELVTTSTTTVFNNVFGANTAAGLFDPDGAGTAFRPSVSSNNANPAGSDGVQYANCDARLAAFVVFSTPCQTFGGVRYNTSNNVSGILRFRQNGPGQITNGIDYSVDFTYPLFGGTFAAQLQATQNLVYKVTDFESNGVQFAGATQCIGNANFTVTGCNMSSEWRGNATVRWANDMHNVSLRANYTAGVYNEAWDTKTGLTAINATAGLYSTYGIFPKDYLDFDVNYIFTAPFWKELELRATILNIFDKNPMPAQGNSGYYNGIGNPRGRQIEIGLTKKF